MKEKWLTTYIFFAFGRIIRYNLGVSEGRIAVGATTKDGLSVWRIIWWIMWMKTIC